MKTCPKCGEQWPDKANFCARDGTGLRTLPSDPQEPDKESTLTYDGDDGSETGETPERSDQSSEEDLEGFSETQWFMVAAEPDLLKESASPEDLSELQAKYERDGSIPDDVRQQYTLKKQGKKKQK